MSYEKTSVDLCAAWLSLLYMQSSNTSPYSLPSSPPLAMFLYPCEPECCALCLCHALGKHWSWSVSPGDSGNGMPGSWMSHGLQRETDAYILNSMKVAVGKTGL